MGGEIERARFVSYVFQRVNGTTESRCPPGDAWLRRHTLMVMCTTTGNLRERFVKRLRQISMYDCYGLRRGHDSTPLMGPFTGLTDAPKKRLQCYNMQDWARWRDMLGGKEGLVDVHITL